MEQETENYSLTGPFLISMVLFFFAAFGVRIVLIEALGVADIFAKPVTMFFAFLAGYPLLRAVPPKPGRKRITLFRWSLLAIVVAILIVPIDYLVHLLL